MVIGQMLMRRMTEVLDPVAVKLILTAIMMIRARRA